MEQDSSGLHADQPFAIDMLLRAAQSELGAPEGELVTWDCRPIHGGFGEAFGARAALYRLRGTLRTEKGIKPWSLVLKTVSRNEVGLEPASPFYWRRELLVEQSSLRGNLPPGLVMPRWYSFDESPEEYWAWQEDLGAMGAQGWTRREYGTATRALGRFNGTYAAKRPIPTWGWLSRGFLRSWVKDFEAEAVRLPSVRDHPEVRRLYPDDVFERFTAFWEAREAHLDLLDRLPQTLCHHDANPRNMRVLADEGSAFETALIDWTSCGHGALGEDLGLFVWDSYTTGVLAPEELDEIEEVSVEQYLAGLRDAGWKGDERMVRLAYALNTALRYAPPLGLDSLLNPEGRAMIEHLFGIPYELVMERFSEVIRRVLDGFDSVHPLLELW